VEGGAEVGVVGLLRRDMEEADAEEVGVEVRFAAKVEAHGARARVAATPPFRGGLEAGARAEVLLPDRGRIMHVPIDHLDRGQGRLRQGHLDRGRDPHNDRDRRDEKQLLEICWIE